MLANLATLLKIPVITSASEPNGPNGPLMPEIHQFAPHAVYVGRKGEVNAWDHEDFVRTVRYGRAAQARMGLMRDPARSDGSSMALLRWRARAPASLRPAAPPNGSGHFEQHRDKARARLSVSCRPAGVSG
jgi:hypothetical protein